MAPIDTCRARWVSISAPFALFAASAAWLTYFAWGQLALASFAVRGVGASLLGLCALAAALPRRWARVHIALASAVLGVLAGFATSRALGHWPFAWDALPDARYAALIALVAAASAVGLLRDAVWARWTALALAGGATLGGALNSLGQLGWRHESAWLAAVTTLGGALGLLQLLRPEVVARVRRTRGGELWAVRDRMVTLARAAAISAFAATCMLVLYALGQPIVPSTATWALALAPITALGAVLVLRARAVGLVILGLSGLALAALTAATSAMASAPDRQIAGYYACFWLPAALLGPAAAIMALARARRRRLAG